MVTTRSSWLLLDRVGFYWIELVTTGSSWLLLDLVGYY